MSELDFKMKVFLMVIAASLGAILSVSGSKNLREENYINLTDFMNMLKEKLKHMKINTNVSENDVTYYFFDKTSSTGVEIKSTNVEALRNTTFSKFRKTVFIIHGWEGDKGSEVNHEVREALFVHNDINVFIVDWGPVAARDYVSAKLCVIPVGKLVAKFISFLMKQYRVRIRKVALIGFSLGGQIAANAGAALDGKIGLIVGLDPAGPLFSRNITSDRLDPTDAQYVHVIHTNAKCFGYRFPCGHSDYFPNGAGDQPGCPADNTTSCDHSRAVHYYAESLLTQKSEFVATKCPSYEDYTSGRCSRNPTSVLGGFPVNRRARGTYYLKTNSAPPYAKGKMKHRL